jgi:hypothetical protein
MIENGECLKERTKEIESLMMLFGVQCNDLICS